MIVYYCLHHSLLVARVLAALKLRMVRRSSETAFLFLEDSEKPGLNRVKFYLSGSQRITVKFTAKHAMYLLQILQLFRQFTFIQSEFLTQSPFLAQSGHCTLLLSSQLEGVTPANIIDKVTVLKKFGQKNKENASKVQKVNTIRT